MGEVRRSSSSSCDDLGHKSLTRISNRVEKKFSRTVSWCREHLGTRKPKQKTQGYNEAEEGSKTGDNEVVRGKETKGQDEVVNGDEPVQIRQVRITI